VKIDVVKFDGTNNFEMWSCEVIDALTISDLEDALCLKESRRRLLKGLGQDELDGMWRH